MSLRARKIRRAALLALLVLPASVQAAPSQTECKIILCVFQPHEPECAEAMVAAAKRVLKGDPRVPSMGSCTVDGDSQGIVIVSTIVARIGDDEPFRSALGECRLAENATIPGTTSPRGCTGTYRQTGLFQYGNLIYPFYYEKIRGVPR